jgi:hypothetical protein
LPGPSTQNSTYESTTSNLILAGECIDNSHAQTDSNGDLTTALSRFWETESIGIKSIEEAGSPDGSDFLKDIRFTGERYEVGLPWIEDRPEIGNDFDLCYNRLKLLHRKLKKQSITSASKIKYKQVSWKRSRPQKTTRIKRVCIVFRIMELSEMTKS